MFCPTALSLLLLLINVLLCRGATSKTNSGQPEYISFGKKYSKGSYRFVKNSQVCETTPGVTTYSGYVEVGDNMSSYFWFFEARNKPETAPFALWLNGGPGCSSMIGLFQENGPCKISEDGTSSALNPYSYNEYANVLYLDQPVGTGFSYGLDDVYSASQAAPHVWGFFQILFKTEAFSKYNSREFALFTESYGGRYGPLFAEYFLWKNQLIRARKENAYPIHLGVLGINNGWYDAAIQYQSYVDYAQAKYNKRFDLVDAPTLHAINVSLHEKGGCLSRIGECTRTGGNEACRAADEFCSREIAQLAIGRQNPYYILRNSSDKFPSDSYTKFLAQPKVMRAIGAEYKYTECADAPNALFSKTGDDVRSTLPSLTRLLEGGLRIIAWAGADDFICNTLGGLRTFESIKWKYQNDFIHAQWKPLVLKGQTMGVYKAAGPLTYITVFNAGHELAAYQPEVAQEVFRQALFNEPVHSVKPKTE